MLFKIQMSFSDVNLIYDFHYRTLRKILYSARIMHTYQCIIVTFKSRSTRDPVWEAVVLCRRRLVM